jgi:hypothetical protein
MPERNRVTPTGEIVATPLRGAWTGNRGVLHEGREIVRSHAGNLWITCALEFRGRHRELWIPNRWTPLFFHDEAVALAAGHRPCGECRHREYEAYKAAWADALGGPPPSAGEMNRRLQPSGSTPAPTAAASTRRLGPSSPMAPSSLPTTSRTSSSPTS